MWRLFGEPNKYGTRRARFSLTGRIFNDAIGSTSCGITRARPDDEFNNAHGHRYRQITAITTTRVISVYRGTVAKRKNNRTRDTVNAKLEYTVRT